MAKDTTGKGTSDVSRAGGVVQYSKSSKADWTNHFYGQYARGRLRIDSEYRRYLRDQLVDNHTSEVLSDIRGWYVSGSYRVMKRLELGSYYSRHSGFTSFGCALAGFDPNQSHPGLTTNHIYDKAITERA